MACQLKFGLKVHVSPSPVFGIYSSVFFAYWSFLVAYDVILLLSSAILHQKNNWLWQWT